MFFNDFNDVGFNTTQWKMNGTNETIISVQENAINAVKRHNYSTTICVDLQNKWFWI